MTHGNTESFDERLAAYYLRGDTYARIAIFMGIPIGSVAAHIKRLERLDKLRRRSYTEIAHMGHASATSDGGAVEHWVPKKAKEVKPNVSTIAFPDAAAAKRRLMGSK